jgi:diketogulonate reductase-like aldo/keto reductase
MAIPTHTLNDGHEIPAIGLGTYGLRGEAGTASVVSAIDAGYRLLDTALNYENEREVGEAVRRSSVPRADIVVTTKLPGRHHGYEETRASFEESRANLGLDYVDLYLIHWPLPLGQAIASDPIIAEIALAHGVTASQVVLRWHVQLGAIPIPKSADPGRQRENIDVFAFSLSDAEMRSIDSLESGRLWGADPVTHEEF